MIYNKLSGSTITNYSELFDRFNSNECFLAFARGEQEWGECSLANISLDPTKHINDIFLYNVVTNPTPFKDKRVLDAKLSNRTVFIYRTSASVPDFDTNVLHYTKIYAAELSQEPIYLEYMNSNWCQLLNLPANYADILPMSDNIDSYKYYIFPPQEFYSINPLQTNVQNKNFVKINLKSKFTSNTLNENVKLMIDINSGNTSIPYPIFNDAYLVKSTTILGEIYITGLTDSIINNNKSKSESELINYTNNSPNINNRNTKPFFYLADAQGNAKSTRMYLQGYTNLYRQNKVYYTDANQSKYLLFQTETRDSQNSDSYSYYYTKISLAQAYNGLAIYNETLPFEYSEVDSPVNISDANPPALDINYIKTPTVSKSMFEVFAYMRIKNVDNDREFRFCRQIRTSEQRQQYKNSGFTDNISDSKHFETLISESSEPFIRYTNLIRDFRSPTTGDWVFYLYNNVFFVGEIIVLRYSNETIQLEILDSNFDLNYIVCNKPVLSNVYIPKKLIEAISYDKADIYLSNTENTIINKTEYAICNDYDDALEYQMDSVMVDKSVINKGTNIYDGSYRQLAICYKPSIIDGNGDKINLGTSGMDNIIDTENTKLYNASNRRYETGSILYLSNKNHIIRRVIDNNVPEIFKIIV